MPTVCVLPPPPTPTRCCLCAHRVCAPTPQLWAQPVAAFFFAFYRALLFSFVAAFTAVIFGSKSVGRITGLLYTTTAFFILLQTPMIHFTTNQLHNNYLPLHLIDVGIVAIPAYVLCFALRCAAVCLSSVVPRFVVLSMSRV